MNSDIVLEILRHLHLCPEENGGALLAEKVILSEKGFSDLREIKCMSFLFSGCARLNYPVGRNWNTSEVTNMDSMFADCVILDRAVGKNWNTPNVVCLLTVLHLIEQPKKIGTPPK
jgi:hypothetical protein